MTFSVLWRNSLRVQEAQSGKAIVADTKKTQAERNAVIMELNAAIVTVRDDTPLVLAVREKDVDMDGEVTFGLPYGPFEPTRDRTLETGVRRWVEEQTELEMGYFEQLYTFGDRGRHSELGDEDRHVSVGYLALTDRATDSALPDAVWRSWYDYFPWEDHRGGFPDVVDEVIRPALEKWAKTASSDALTNLRQDRVRTCFGSDAIAWDDEQILERYELLYEAELVSEAFRGGEPAQEDGSITIGMSMRFDHRRILATAMGRLRGKLKYRPVIFELMPDSFTLLELQRTVEAIAGVHLHKQNFRRLVATSGLVENTGTLSTQTGGRPAQLFRFRREVLQERVAPGVRMPSPRGRR